MGLALSDGSDHELRYEAMQLIFSFSGLTFVTFDLQALLHTLWTPWQLGPAWPASRSQTGPSPTPYSTTSPTTTTCCGTRCSVRPPTQQSAPVPPPVPSLQAKCEVCVLSRSRRRVSAGDAGPDAPDVGRPPAAGDARPVGGAAAHGPGAAVAAWAPPPARRRPAARPGGLLQVGVQHRWAERLTDRWLVALVCVCICTGNGASTDICTI